MTELEEGIGWRRMLVALAVLIVLGVGALAMMGTQVSGILSTVGSSVNTPGSIGGNPVGGNPVGGGADPGTGGDSGGSTGGGVEPGGVELLSVTRPDLLIIKTGSITVQAAEIDQALAAATSEITALGGYASASERSGDGDDRRASVTFRMPSARWEEAVVAIRGVGEKVLDERSATEDVTGQVVDLEARIRNLQTTEAALQAIMDRATVIKDVLGVQAELTTVRGEIEQLASKAAHLQEQAAMSTLSVTISSRPTPAIALQEAQFDPGGEAEAATAQLVGVMQSLATAGIWFAIMWLPLLFGLVLVGSIGLLIFRRFRGSSGHGAPPMATASGATP